MVSPGTTRRMLAAAAVLMGARAIHGQAQSLARQVTASDGIVQVVYPSRPTACGDGRSFVGNVLGHAIYSSGMTFDSRGGWNDRICVHGPARALATVTNGEITRLATLVGPERAGATRSIAATASDAAAWLGTLIGNGTARVASESMLAFVLADGTEPWPLLLRVARDDSRPIAVRRSALTWLAAGVNEHLGLSDAVAGSDDDEMRKQAVFVLSQRPKSESVPELIELARSSKNPVARREAIFWLGQTGDLRASDVYAELLRLRQE